ncbi:putative low-affinity inorganic phosphate transporter [Fimbriiglobus ruber]|uniref:Phosphate transporter n=1 Tax=Fimbriiglobus ruber TaxID=1908690 RepID=A0A225DBA8_9BACT|nr:putative low-affinity inorganic phosphate transporter [Fimbriiglobus ruber]
MLIVLAVVFVAYSNGSNDNFKGVATLFGSGTCSYRQALVWATLTTLAGSLLALYLAGGLIESFKGKGLVPEAVTRQPAFLMAVSLGAAITVLLATRTGMPVSTTHALTGGLVGAGLLAAAGDVRFASLGTSFVLPLLFSPVVALVLTVAVYPLFRRARRFSGVTSSTCVCVGGAYEEVRLEPDGRLLLVRTSAVLAVEEAVTCVDRYRGRVIGLEAGRVLDAAHYLSGGAVGFARGLNDTPKIVALMLAAEALPPLWGLTLVAAAMTVGGVLNSRRVAETMSKKITRMNPGQGFTANLITSLLVAGASHLGLPVSTTHVSVGALFGIGVVNGSARVKTVLTILLAWVTTLPVGAALAAVFYLLLRALEIGA